jgi:hypothetical protein
MIIIRVGKSAVQIHQEGPMFHVEQTSFYLMRAARRHAFFLAQRKEAQRVSLQNAATRTKAGLWNIPDK